MSRIGDYIHYTTINYLNYGTAHKGDTPRLSEASLAQQKAKILSSIHTASADSRGISTKGMNSEAGQLIRNIEFLFRPPDEYVLSELGMAYNEYDVVWNEVLLPRFRAEWENADSRIRRETGNIYARAPSVQDFTKIKEGQQINASTIMSRVRALSQALTNGYKMVDGMKIEYSAIELQQLSVLVQRIGDALAELDDATTAQLARVFSEVVTVNINKGKLSGTQQTRRQWYSDSKLAPSQKLQQIVDAINSAIAVGKGTANVQRGILFERAFVAAGMIGRNLTRTALKNAVRAGIGGDGTDVITGGLKSKVGYSTVDFDSGLDLEKIIPGNYEKINDVLYEATVASQDKVDVRLQLNPTQEPINFSLKNVNLTGKNAKPVTIVNGAPLLAMMANMGNHDFVNHYLNQHSHSLSFFATPLYYRDTAKLMTLSVIEQAFRGYKKNTMKANVFVINDNLTGKVQIFNIGDILQYFLEDGNFQYALVEPNLFNFYVYSAWDPSGYPARIERLLALIAKEKVTVKILPQLFLDGVI